MSLKVYLKEEDTMKRNLNIIISLIGVLILWNFTPAEASRVIIEKQIMVSYVWLENALLMKTHADENADARILKVAQNLNLSPSLPSSPPPFYPPTITPSQPTSPPANPPPIPSQPPIPSRNAPQTGVTNPRTGEFYPGTFGGVINPRTGVFLPKVDGGYLNPETGEVIPKQ
jgi:hypothetical protein